MDNKTIAIIVAGGTGKRMGAEIPKQFLDLAGKPIIVHTLEKFEKSSLVDGIIIVSHKDHVAKTEQLVEEHKIAKVLKVVPGGETRQGSSYNGLKACPEDTEYVLIHDAVRPFVDERMIKDVLEAAKEIGASTTAIESADTVVLAENDIIKDIPERKYVRRVQTPQGFKYDKIVEAHEKALSKGITDSTDDCGIILGLRGNVKLVEGSGSNIKITESKDLFLSRYISDQIN